MKVDRCRVQKRMPEDLLHDRKRDAGPDKLNSPGMAQDMRMRQLARDPRPAAELPEDREKVHAADRKCLALHIRILREITRKLVDGLQRDRNDLPAIFLFRVLPLENVHRDFAGAEVNVRLVVDSRNLRHPGASVPQKKIDQKIPAPGTGIVRRRLVVENLELGRKLVELFFVQVLDSLLGNPGHDRRRIRL